MSPLIRQTLWVVAYIIFICLVARYVDWFMKPDKNNKKKVFNLLVTFIDTDGVRREKETQVHGIHEHKARRTVLDYHLNLGHQVLMISSHKSAA